MKPGRNKIITFPEKYSIAMFGRRRSTMTSLDFIEKRSGTATRTACLEKFGVNETLFEDPMAPISMGFITDLCRYLRRHHGYEDRDFFAMGAYSAVGNRNTLLAETFSRAKKLSQVYELLFGDMLKYYEQNCSYSLLELGESSAVVEVTSNPYIPEALGVRALGSHEICRWKEGWMASAMDYLDLPFARVKETACVHKGDSSCRFELDFSEAIKTRRFQ